VTGLSLETGTRVTSVVGLNDGVEEVPLFFGNDLFGSILRPQGPASPGWVYCSAFGSEKTNSQRLGFTWAHALAASGSWVLRFDYRGTGDSRGVFPDFSLDEYLEDIERARHELECVSGMRCRGLLGLRLGASLAAISASRCDRELDLVMWEPIIDGSRYRDSLLRTAIANELVHHGGHGRTRNDLRRKVADGGSVFVDGFELKERMFESLASVNLRSLGRPTEGRVLIVKIKSGRAQAIPPAFSDLHDMYVEHGETRLECVEEPPVWMRTRTYHWDLSSLFDTTLEWVREGQATPEKPNLNRVIDPGTMRNSGSVEKPVEFLVEEVSVRGIIHEPCSTRDNATFVILIAAGEACRSAFFYPFLARNLADSGWPVLRFDPRGIGDSGGDLGCTMLEEVFAKVEDGALVTDTLAAMDYLEGAQGARKFVLSGLCGGAITAIRAACVDDRVVGILPLELPMRLTPRTHSDQSRSSSRQVPWYELLQRMHGASFLLKLRRMYHVAKNLRREVARRATSILAHDSRPRAGNTEWYREKIGSDASVPMLAALECVVDKRIPVHCVFADTEQPRLFEAVLPRLVHEQLRTSQLVTHCVIRGADHNFTMSGTGLGLTEAVVSWLGDANRPESRG
jgi:pimeloyl-ACP methyl ester carboxylesterase